MFENVHVYGGHYLFILLFMVESGEDYISFCWIHELILLGDVKKCMFWGFMFVRAF